MQSKGARRYIFTRRIPKNPEIKSEDTMKGIQFLTDEEGQKTAVLIDLKKHNDVWEDFYDSILAHEREEEPRETFDSVKKRILEKKE